MGEMNLHISPLVLAGVEAHLRAHLEHHVRLIVPLEGPQLGLQLPRVHDHF